MTHLKKLFELTRFAGLLFMVLGIPDSAETKVFDRVVAKVNNEIITLSSVEERAGVLKQKYGKDLKSTSEKEILQEALNMIVEEKLQIQEGKKMGLEVDDAAVEAALENIRKTNNIAEGQLEAMLESEGRSMESYKDHVRDQIIVSKITRFELGGRLNISDKSIAKYYHDNQKEFWQLGKARAKHILLLVEKDLPEVSKNKKFLQAKKILGEIKAGKDFSEAAKEYSEDISASSGGDIGFVEKGKMVPEFEKAVFSLKEGEISDIVVTEYGYHIVKVEEVLPGKTLPFKEIKERIRQILAGKKQKSVYDEWIKELKKSSFIEISLFDEPEKNRNTNLSNSKKYSNNANFPLEPNEIVEGSEKKQKLQEKWKEMYKSVEKSKTLTKNSSSSSFESMEQKLERIKKLRSQNKITEAEYQKRKQRLLNDL